MKYLILSTFNKLWGYSQSPKEIKKSYQRFEEHYQQIDSSLPLYRIHDNQTNKDYLATGHGGIIEIEPTIKKVEQ